jgi:hypothetical protein
MPVKNWLTAFFSNITNLTFSGTETYNFHENKTCNILMITAEWCFHAYIKDLEVPNQS